MTPTPDRDRIIAHHDGDTDPVSDFVETTLPLVCTLAGGRFDRIDGVAPSPQTWQEASLVLLDEQALPLCVQAGLPPRPGVCALFTRAEAGALWRDAAVLGVQHTVMLPIDRTWLRHRLEGVLRTEPQRRVLLVRGAPAWPQHDLEALS